MFKEVYLKLKEKGFDVYSVGQQVGEFPNGYIVIMEMGDIATSNKVGVIGRIDLYCYYPFNNYSEVADWRESIIDSVLELRGYKQRYEASNIIVDDSKTAYQFKLSFSLKKRKKEGRY